MMDTVTLGRTGLEVSVVGLGCGGHSRLGMANGQNESYACRLVTHALDLGINFIDTARAYGTETAVGKAIRGKRNAVVISTKSSARRGERLLSAGDLRDSLELSLRRLGTDYIDIFHLHGVAADQYEHCVEVLIPELERQREIGKIRFLGVTERFGADTNHAMLELSLPDDYFDVVMVGYNLLNPSARISVFPQTLERNIGTLIMFAVRRALSQPQRLREVVDELIELGAVSTQTVDRSDPLGFVAAHPQVRSLVEAAYRFCREEPGVHVTLTGTGNSEHLRENVAAILAPPLPGDITVRLRKIFGDVDTASGN